MLVVPKYGGRIACCLLGLVALAMMPSWAAGPQYEPGQIIVKFTPEIGKVDVRERGDVVSVGIGSLDGKMMHYGVYRAGQLFPHKSSELAFIYQFDFDPHYDARQVAEDFAGDEHLLYAEPRYIQRLCDVPNDTFYVAGLQWYLNTVQAPEAWDVTHGDSTVVIGIVDTGVDLDHPDLEDNIWVNPGEDLNGNGQIETHEWNFIDDDGNGYVDDFYGWDFGGAGYPDNYPMEAAAIHGTHVAGIASAVTNNKEGVAGVSWNCAIMAVKASRDDQETIPYGYEGILYAAENGADVINLSWGSHGESQYAQEIIDSAFARGAIIVAAAGNDPGVTPPDTCQRHYPSAYDHVTAVAATNTSDHATSWTYYGDWVDVAAPGAGIYNTWFDDIYAMLQGTSMSSPLVAGIAGLLRTVDPDMNSDEFEEKIWHTADDIYPLNPGYVGLLGGGRANAYSALLSLMEPHLALEEETTIDDEAGGNGDGRPDPGETVDWIVSLSNALTWQTAQDVGVKVSTADERITFVVDSVGFGDIEAGATVDNSSGPFQFSVAAGDTAHWTTFYFLVESNGGMYTMTDSLEMMIGRPEVLVVDDDGGDDLEEVYQEDLEGMDVIYDVWEVVESGKISAEELGRYMVVIWLTGAEAESTLTVEDQDHLATFLDGGNNLFLTGQNIGDEIGTSSFFSDYLHVSHLADTVSLAEPYLDGVEGDVITDGTTLLLVGGEPQDSPSGVEAIDGAVGIYTYRIDVPEGDVAAVRYESPKGYKLVYFAFGYEGILGTGGYTKPQVVLKRMMNWFGVETEVSQDREATGELPHGYALLHNYPNPFNAETTISYRLPNATSPRLTTLRIYNILGQEVRTLVQEVQGPGNYSVRWDGRDFRGEEVSTAIYFCRLESGDFSQTNKMVLLR